LARTWPNLAAKRRRKYRPTRQTPYFHHLHHPENLEGGPWERHSLHRSLPLDRLFHSPPLHVGQLLPTLITLRLRHPVFRHSPLNTCPIYEIWKPNRLKLSRPTQNFRRKLSAYKPATRN